MNADDTRAMWKRLGQQLAQTPNVAEEVQQLVDALADQRDTRITCEVCQPMLPRFMEEERSGLDVVQRYPHIKRHLDTCPVCEAAYVDMHSLVEIEATAGAEAPPVPLSLSFLPKLTFTDYLREVLHEITARRFPVLVTALDREATALLQQFQRGQALQVRESPASYGEAPSAMELAYLTFITVHTLASVETTTDTAIYQMAFQYARAQGLADAESSQFAEVFTETVAPTLVILRQLPSP